MFDSTKYNWKKPRGYNKFEMLYPDRGIMKFNGFILSEHKERMNDYNARQNGGKILNEEQRIKACAKKAFETKEKVIVLANVAKEPMARHKGIITIVRKDSIIIDDGEHSYMVKFDDIISLTKSP